MGDSISIGYTHEVCDNLAGRANVHRALESPTAYANCTTTAMTLTQLDRWLGDKPWAVIHCNWGLHDIKRMSGEGDAAQLQVLIGDYRTNLEALIRRLEATGATLIFATTTPVPEGAKNRANADVVHYNATALEGDAAV